MTSKITKAELSPETLAWLKIRQEAFGEKPSSFTKYDDERILLCWNWDNKADIVRSLNRARSSVCDRAERLKREGRHFYTFDEALEYFR